MFFKFIMILIQGTVPVQMETFVICRNIHIGPRPGQKPRQTVSVPVDLGVNEPPLD